VSVEGSRTHAIYAEDVPSALTARECERLAALAIDAAVLEIGSQFGRSTIALASTARFVHAVDPHTGRPPDIPSSLPTFVWNIEAHGVREKVVIHVGTSMQVVPTFRSELFDLVFIDAVHQRPSVDIDLALSAPCLRPGGRIAFHDYGLTGVAVGETWYEFGVTEAVDDFVAAASLDPPDIVDTLAIIESPLDPAGREAWHDAVAALPTG
jgi:predicted O-methyltransferase YrrM